MSSADSLQFEFQNKQRVYEFVDEKMHAYKSDRCQQ